jgi:hypothetical protein
MGELIDVPGPVATLEHILIDYENVEKAIEADDLRLIDGGAFHVTVFCGPTQKKISKELVIAMQRLGTNGQYVDVTTKGPNALDFHIAYYLGRLSSAKPDSSFHIIAEDRDYDPLIQHLKEKGLSVRRVACIGEIASVKAAKKLKRKKRLEDTLGWLEKMAVEKRPGTLEGLQNTLQNRCRSLEEQELAHLIQGLKNGFVSENGGKLEYHLARPSQGWAVGDRQRLRQ